MDYDSIKKTIQSIQDETTKQTLTDALNMFTQRISCLEQNVNIMRDSMFKQITGYSSVDDTTEIPEEWKLTVRDFVCKHMNYLIERVTKKRCITYQGDCRSFNELYQWKSQDNLSIIMKTHHDEIIGIFVKEKENDNKKHPIKDKCILFYAKDKNTKPTIVENNFSCLFGPEMKKDLSVNDDFLSFENHFVIKGDGTGYLFKSCQIFSMNTKRQPDRDCHNFLEETLSDDKTINIENIYVLSWS